MTIGEAGWLDKLDSVDVCEQQTFSATIDGVSVDVLDSGCHKWENNLFDPNMGANTNWSFNADGAYASGCDAHFESKPPGRPELWKTRESGESCWGRTVGVDLSTLEVGDYVVETVFTQEAGNGPADAAATNFSQTITIHVNECE